MTAREFQRIQAEEDERHYQEWAMRQPGYWRDFFVSFVLAFVFMFGAAIVFGALL